MLNRDEFRLGMIFGRLGSSVAPNIVMEDWRLFVLARERKCEAFTSQQRTSSPGKLQCDQSNVSFIRGWRGGLLFLISEMVIG